MDSNNNNEQNSANGPNAPVMDIQPPTPKPQDDSTPSLATEPTASPEVSPTNTATSDVTSPEPAPDPIADASSGANYLTPETHPTQAVAPTPKKHGAPKAAVAIAIIIALVLAGVTVFAYLKTKNNTPAGNQQTQESTEAPVTTQEVDDTSSEVEEAIDATNDAADLDSNEVSDTNLGL